MAKTIDELVLKASVEGVEKVEQLNSSVKDVQKNINGFRATIIANQIQDMAVQAELGTNWTRILAQQLPQLGTAFGPVGAAAGAVAAIFFAVLTPALKAAGVDLRNVKEITDDLSKSLSDLQDAQKQNQPNVQGLATAYGELSGLAKDFFDAREKANSTRTEIEAKVAVRELAREYDQLRGFVQEYNDTQKRVFGGLSSLQGIADTVRILGNYWKGLSPEQADKLSKSLEGIDQKSPKEAIKTLSEITTYLTEATKGTDKFERVWENVIVPIDKINQKLLEQQRNIRAAADAASGLQTDLTNFQNQFSPDVNKAKRNFDQITAINLEGRMKIAEFNRQMLEKENQGSLTKEVLDKERASGLLRIQQDTADKVKDFAKGQQEAFYAQQLSNEAKVFQLDLQRKINELQLGQVNSINYQSIAEENSLKNIREQQQALLAIEELRRKNLVTEERADRLREQAGDIRKQQDALTLQQITRIEKENTRAVEIQVQGLKFSNYQKSVGLELEMKGFLMSSRSQEFSKKQQELSERRYMTEQDIKNNTKLSDDEKVKALEKINGLYDDGLKLLKQELGYRLAIDNSYSAGAMDRLKQIQESFTPFKQGGMIVDSVFNQMGSAIDKFVETGKFSFSDFTRSIIFDIEKILLKAAAINFLKAGASAMGFAIPGLASGGGVTGGSPYLVGEQGPELFIPSGAGSIVPNSKIGGMGGNTYVTNNISAIDSKSVAQLFAENRRTLFGNVEQARRELPMRTR